MKIIKKLTIWLLEILKSHECEGWFAADCKDCKYYYGNGGCAFNKVARGLEVRNED